MLDTKIQIPVNSKVLAKSKKKAEKMGFSSINELVRVFLTNVAEEKVSLKLSNNDFSHIPYVSKEEQKEIEEALDKLSDSDKEIVFSKEITIDED